MGKTRWTPGPWEAREVRTQAGRAFRIGAGEMLEPGKGCCIIYDDHPGNPDNERAANAHLIAAAPDLARELQATADMLQRLLDHEDVSDSARSEVAVQLQSNLEALSKAAPPQIEE